MLVITFLFILGCTIWDYMPFSFYNPIVHFMVLQAQKRKLGLLDDEDTSKLEDTVSNKKQNFGENLPNNRGVFDLSY